MSLFRKNIDSMEGYKPGEQLGEGYTKLNTNENPYPPSPIVIEAVRAAAEETLNLYPAPAADDLREKAADVYSVSPSNVLVGNGSDELLTIAVRSFVGEGEKIAYPYPSYVLYRTLSEIQNAGPPDAVEFPADYSLPKELMKTDARLVFLSNPNTPTGTFIPVDEIEELASSISCVLLVDEAYVDFAEDNCLRLIEDHKNVVITRSFSKSFSLAGVRLGLMFATEELIEGMAKVKDSYNVGRIPIAAGVAALDDIGYMEENVALIIEERDRVTSELEKRGFTVIPSSSNFVLAESSKVRAEDLYQKLKDEKILIRYFADPPLDGSVRISIGTPEQSNTLLAAMDEILQP